MRCSLSFDVYAPSYCVYWIDGGGGVGILTMLLSVLEIHFKEEKQYFSNQVGFQTFTTTKHTTKKKTDLLF